MLSATTRMSSNGNVSGEIRIRESVPSHHFFATTIQKGQRCLVVLPNRPLHRIGREWKKNKGAAEVLACPAHFGPRTLSTACQVGEATPRKLSHPGQQQLSFLFSLFKCKTTKFSPPPKSTSTHPKMSGRHHSNRNAVASNKAKPTPKGSASRRPPASATAANLMDTPVQDVR